jgi:hypothetical protein
MIQVYVDPCRAHGYFTLAFYATAIPHMEHIHVRRQLKQVSNQRIRSVQVYGRSAPVPMIWRTISSSRLSSVTSRRWRTKHVTGAPDAIPRHTDNTMDVSRTMRSQHHGRGAPTGTSWDHVSNAATAYRVHGLTCIDGMGNSHVGLHASSRRRQPLHP